MSITEHCLQQKQCAEINVSNRTGYIYTNTVPAELRVQLICWLRLKHRHQTRKTNKQKMQKAQITSEENFYRDKRADH